MGEFKPMVKMETTEPSVILKLKKGGSAHKKMMGGGMMKHGGSSDHKPMQGKMNGGVMGALSGATPVIRGTTAAPVARMPMRPSMASRRKAMMAKAPMMPKKMMAKDGGKACKDGGDVEKELKAHASKPASKAHAGLKKGGMACKTGGVALGNGGGYKKGGMAKHKMNMGGTAYKKGGMACATGGVTLGNGGGYKKGGKACATGGVALGNAGGYKKGGASKKAYANGGSVNDEGKAISMPQGNKKPSSPVSISKLSGTFKKGGNVSSKELQGFFKKENATAMKESKAKLLDKYSPYQKAGGGQVSDTEYESVMKAEKSGKKTMIDKTKGATSDKDKKYSSGMTDTDIDKIISSKEVKEGMSRFVDKKRGGKVGK